MSDRPHPFSPEGRQRALSRMNREAMDLIVIGGGITGCGIAREASIRGLRVALLEKEDFGFGTSGRSSKIIHGGVRYLQYGQVMLVRESARERGVLRRIAPHLVHPIDFMYPVFGRDSLLKIRLGLKLFDFLAGAKGMERSRALPPEGVRKRLPGLRDPLKGGVTYLEYITDDARLTLENAISAAEHGALVANHAPIVDFVEERGRIEGVQVADAFTGDQVFVRGTVVVNATGPWAADVLRKGKLPIGSPIIPSKGIHICFRADRLPIDGATFLTASSGRQGLAMRRGDHVYVGTSDEEYRESLDRPRASRAEVEELLEMTRDCFPELGLTLDDVESTWAGIRPLILEEGKATRDMSRKDEIWIGPPNLVTIAGGKLTTYRPMAKRTLRHVERILGRRLPGADIDGEIPLPGSPPELASHDLSAEEREEALDRFRAPRRKALLEAGVPEPVVARLFRLYGLQIDTLLAFGGEDAAWLTPLGPGVPALRGEVRLAVEQEMAGTVTDFMNRRSALLLFSDDFALAGVEEVVEIMAPLLRWNEQRRIRELSEYRSVAAESGVPR